jgi:CheY-like chemotaxis protein
MQRLWPVAIVVLAALALVGSLVLTGQPTGVVGGVVIFAALAVALMLAGSRGGGSSRRAELERAQRRIREAARPVQETAGPVAAAPAAAAEPPGAPSVDRTRLETAERLLAESRAEVERLAGEVSAVHQREREAEQRATAMSAASNAAVEERKRAEAALKDSRAEVERLKGEVADLRRQAAAAPAPGPKPAAEPARPASAPPPAASPAPPAATPLAPEKAAAAPAPPAPTAPKPVPAPPPPAAPPRPQGPALSPQPATAAPSTPTARPAAPTTGSGTVLLVDDDADFRTVAATILRRAGYEVIEADGGPAALEQAQQHTGAIDLLVTDIVMPGMNGRQLAQRFTQLRRGVRVLYVSGVVDEASAREAIAGEDADFLEKPFEADAFTAKVWELLPASRKGA